MALLGERHRGAQILYVIPTMSKEDEKMKEASMQNKVYDPLNDSSLTLDQITKLIKHQNDSVKALFKRFCEATPDSPEKSQLQQDLKERKATLTAYLQKEKDIKRNFAIKK